MNSDSKPEGTDAIASKDLLGDGTELYRKTIAADYGDAEQKALMKSEWSPTPWMLDVCHGDQESEILDWCYRTFGRQSSPMHGHDGTWRRGNVTMHGRTWFGFKSKMMLDLFEAQFPSPNEKLTHSRERKET